MPLYSPKVGNNGVVKQIKEKLAVDSSTTSATFVDLLSATITTAGGTNLLIWIETSLTCSNYYERPAMFNLVVDGYEVLRAGDETYQATNSGAIVYRSTDVSSGTHTVKIQWRLNQVGDGTIYCRPQTYPELEAASIHIMEVSV